MDFIPNGSGEFTITIKDHQGNIVKVIKKNLSEVATEVIPKEDK